MQKHTDLCAHEFAHCPDLWYQPMFANVTCAWSRRLCGINFAICVQIFSAQPLSQVFWDVSNLFVCETWVYPAQHCCTFTMINIYRVSQEEWTKLRESVSYVELYRYNPKHLYPKLNGYGDNGHRKVLASGVSTYCTTSVTPYSSTAHARQPDTAS